MTAATSRRAVLAGVAAIPALSLPANASAPELVTADDFRRAYREMDADTKALLRALVREDDAAGGGDDAELIALGKQFDELALAEKEAVARWKPQWDAFDRALAKRDKDSSWSDDTYKALWQRVEQEYPAAKPHPDDVSDAMDQPVRRIMELAAHTMEGLKVKARAARHVCDHFWKETDADAPWEQLVTRKAIDAVLSFEVPAAV